jgi:general secretion pathway protein G
MRFQRGFTLAETLLGTALLAVGLDAAVELVSTRIEQSHVEQAEQDLARLQSAIEGYRAAHHDLPGSLSELGSAVPRDPWGRPYEYVSFDLKGTVGQRSLEGLPINSEYDLYSLGADGRTDANLRSETGRDDIVRGRDGSYIGPAAGF